MGAPGVARGLPLLSARRIWSLQGLPTAQARETLRLTAQEWADTRAQARAGTAVSRYAALRLSPSDSRRVMSRARSAPPARGHPRSAGCRWCPAAGSPVSGRAGIERSHAIVGFVPGDVGVAEDDQAGGRELMAEARQAAWPGTAVVDHRDGHSVDLELGRRRCSPDGDVGTVVGAEDGTYGAWAVSSSRTAAVHT
jgi:hypothetical protein